MHIHLDLNQLATYRYIFKLSFKELADLLNISEKQYMFLENNPEQLTLAQIQILEVFYDRTMQLEPLRRHLKASSSSAAFLKTIDADIKNCNLDYIAKLSNIVRGHIARTENDLRFFNKDVTEKELTVLKNELLAIIDNYTKMVKSDQEQLEEQIHAFIQLLTEN